MTVIFTGSVDILSVRVLIAGAGTRTLRLIVCGHLVLMWASEVHLATLNLLSSFSGCLIFFMFTRPCGYFTSHDVEKGTATLRVERK